MDSSTYILDPDGDLTFILQASLSSKDFDTQEPSAKTSNSTTTPHEFTCQSNDDNLPHKSPVKDNTVKFQVSSKHMVITSPVFKAMLQHRFKAMLQPPFKEGQALLDSGKFEIPLHDANHVAFTIIMDIIHGRGRRVPKKVPLKLLVYLADLVDKYLQYEAVDSFAVSWVDALKRDIMSCDNEDLFRWLCVSWVFRKPDEFGAVTKRIMRKLSAWDCEILIENITQEQYIPLPWKAVDEMDRQRQEALNVMYASIQHQISFYQSPTNEGLGCSICAEKESANGPICNALVLGSLLQGLHSASDIWKASAFPFDKVSPNELVGQIEGIKDKVVSLCYVTLRHKRPDYHPDLALSKSAEETMNGLCGLKLEDWEGTE